ncbi:hypothetical protein Hanom_Chr01g00023371 [Helianthus anomalus]
MALTTSSTPPLLNDLKLSSHSHSHHRLLRSHNTHLSNPTHLLSFPQISTSFSQINTRPLFNNMPLISSRKKVRASSAAGEEAYQDEFSWSSVILPYVCYLLSNLASN